MDRILQHYRKGSVRAQTLVEYGLLLALIAVVVITALLFLGPVIADMFTTIGNQLNPAGGPQPTPVPAP